MTWHLQTPKAGSTKLLQALGEAAVGATDFGGAFAFATASGVQLFFAQPAVVQLAQAGTVTLVVGTDAITDTAAIDALKAQVAKFPNLNVSAFINNGKGCFHPKTAWFDHGAGGVAITGSGNLTTGGLSDNWEAFEVQILGTPALNDLRGLWVDWLASHAQNLRELDDPDVVERAKSNKVKSFRVRKALVEGAEEAPAGELGEADVEAFAEIDLPLEPTNILIAEVPRSKDRWKQVNFDVGTYQTYFGVKLGQKKHVQFYPMLANGTLGDPENRESVDVKSKNYRFEIGAAGHLPYPEEGQPIVVFDRIAEDQYRYVLLMPGNPGHMEVQDHLNENYIRDKGRKFRKIVTRKELSEAWPGHPFVH